MNDPTLNIVGESDQTICTGAAGAEVQLNEGQERSQQTI